MALPPVPETALVARIAVGVGLSFFIGFEREVRGAHAGDRTFSIVGVSAAGVAAAVVSIAPNAITGILTGVGFIGGGLVFRGQHDALRGITTAAALFACTAIGVVAGVGYLLLAAVLTGIVLLLLEFPNIPLLDRLDGRRYQHAGKDEDEDTTTD